MTSRKKTPASHELVSPETTDKPTRKYEADLGIVGVLKRSFQPFELQGTQLVDAGFFYGF